VSLAGRIARLKRDALSACAYCRRQVTLVCELVVVRDARDIPALPVPRPDPHLARGVAAR
jgi:hypothetical protein